MLTVAATSSDGSSIQLDPAAGMNTPASILDAYVTAHEAILEAGSGMVVFVIDDATLVAHLRGAEIGSLPVLAAWRRFADKMGDEYPFWTFELPGGVVVEGVAGETSGGLSRRPRPTAPGPSTP